ncbi:DUF6381 family protein [Streptomyces sp. Je 1-79]|uniref:DUF6381 family protein n=1 Tax=Streptomyces sp. Je 1-79 TaxID=2943847 RepID=UPI0021A8D23F|nr:DUF6381 family protein [Streptomyces sp. Je 1-79]MCT4351573.1 DUF6381 family protein [Streptomyces sp. Je 1-79]
MTGRDSRAREGGGEQSRREGEGAHAHAQYQRDKAENLLQRARRSADPEEAARLREQGEQLKERSEQALREEHEPRPDDLHEPYPG